MNWYMIRNALWHFIFFTLFISFEISVIMLMGTGLKWFYFIPYYLVGVSLFYINVFVVMPIWVRSKPLTFLLIVFELLFHFGAYNWIDTQYSEMLKVSIGSREYVSAGYRIAYFFGISLTYWIVTRNRKQAKEIFNLKLQALELQNRQVVLENDYLRAQANPHLTFNVLNTLYSALEERMPSEANVVRLLSATMDYAMGRAGEDGKIDLGEEIEQVMEKIELYQFLNRGTYRISLESDISLRLGSLRIPPLLLVTLVDNIFMHGELRDERYPAKIVMEYKGKIFTCTMSNQIAMRQGKSHGLGLEFIRRCLTFYYPGRFELHHEKRENIYIVKLSIEL